jgi:hypothetical protein
MATTARFCSQCGERLKYKRATSLPFSSYCNRCAPRFARVRLWLIAAPVLCAIIGFALGHYSGKREPFYYIGTPAELNHIASSPERARSGRDEEALNRSPTLGSPSSAVDGICGAPTKSGRPCQRKVKGGGYCWQHRDKFGDKKQAPSQ